MVIVIMTSSFKTTNAMTGVPNFTGFDPQSIMKYTKDFVLDKLAYTIAKTFIQNMTADIVDWINSGYSGSPAFLDNPQGFFMDSADQVTGAFIAGSGPLSGLCGPFNLDLRLNLALAQTSDYARKRYRCTLSTVVNNAKNARVSASVGTDPNGMTLGDMMNGNVTNNANAISVNGVSIDDTGAFLSGDFGKGGWPAFVALTSEPQNNPYSAYLDARMDLMNRQQQAAAEQRRDLDQGKGFLSFEKCTEVDRAVEDDFEKISEIQKKTAGDKTIKIERKASNGIFYEIYNSCKTETPGSVLSGSLQTQLDSPVKQLELVDSLGEIVDAAMTQMVNKLISKGLASLSKSSGGNISATANLRQQTRKMETRYYLNNEIAAIPAVKTASSTVGELISIHEVSMELLLESKNNLLDARACYTEKKLPVTAIDQKIVELDTLMNSIEVSINGAQADLKALNASVGSLNLRAFETAEGQDEQTALTAEAIQLATDASDKANRAMPYANSTQTTVITKTSEWDAYADSISRSCDII